MDEDIVALKMQVQKLESKHERLSEKFDNDIRSLNTAMRALQTDLRDITGLVRSIKWWVIGAVSFATIDQIGLLEFLKKVM